MDLRPNSTLQKPRAKRTNGPYRGVWKRNDKWVSEIRIPKTNEKIWLGSHDSAVKAAKAYDAAMYCIHGAGELFNFPNNRRPQLADHQIGSLSADEIQRIAREFASVEATNVPAVKPSSMLLSNITHLSLDKPLVRDQLDMIEVVAHKVNFEGIVSTDASKVEPQNLEQVLPTNTSEVEPYIPVFVPEETPIPYGSLPFDETFIKDSDDWILDFMADPSNKN